MSRAGRAAALALVVGVSLWPVWWALMLGRLPGHPYSDLSDHVQGAWWWGGELLAGRLPWRMRDVLAPDGGVVWYPDPVGALLALPFRWLGPGGAYTAAVAIQLALGTVTAWWLGERVGGSPRVGLFTAAVAGPSAYLAGLVHSGLAEYLGVWTLHLGVGALLLHARDGGRARLVVAAVALATVQSAYYGAFTALFAACVVALGPGALSVRARRVVPPVIVGLLAAAPVLAAAWLSLHAPDALVDAATAPGWRQPRPPGVDLVTFVAPFDVYHPDTPALGNPGILHVNHLGLLALALALIGAGGDEGRDVRRVAVAWIVLALGPTLVLGGRPVVLAGVEIPLPGHLLYLPGSPFRLVHHPYRMVSVTLPLLGVLAGIGASRLRPWTAAACALAIMVEAVAASPAPLPIGTTDAALPSSHRDLPRGVVWDLPPDLRGPNRLYVLWSVEHGHPVPYGVNHWLSDGFRDDGEVRALLTPLDLRPRTVNRDVPTPGPLFSRGDRGGLAGLGVGAIVVHLKYLSAQERSQVERMLDSRLGAPSQRGEGWLRWDLSTLPEAP